MSEAEIQFLNENNKVFAKLHRKTSWETIRCLLHYTDEKLVETQFFQNYIEENQIPEINILFFDCENFNKEKFLQEFKKYTSKVKDIFVIFNRNIVDKNIKKIVIDCFKNYFVTETANPFINSTLNANVKYSVVKLITNSTLIKLFKNEKF